jgi:hypothetical protein
MKNGKEAAARFSSDEWSRCGKTSGRTETRANFVEPVFKRAR